MNIIQCLVFPSQLSGYDMHYFHSSINQHLMKESEYLDLKARAEKLIGQETFFDVSDGQKAESMNCKFISLTQVYSASENDGPRVYGNVMGVLQMPDGTTFERPLQQIVAWLEYKNSK